MKKHLRFSNNKTMTAGVIGIALTIALAGISFVPRTANGAFDLEALQRQVDQNTQDIKNHDARISNTEKDVSKLQTDTGVAPASGKVEVPASSGDVFAPLPAGSSTANSSPTAASPTPAEAQPAVQHPSNMTWCIDKQQYAFWMQPAGFYQAASKAEADAWNGATTQANCGSVQ